MALAGIARLVAAHRSCWCGSLPVAFPSGAARARLRGSALVVVAGPAPAIPQVQAAGSRACMKAVFGVDPHKLSVTEVVDEGDTM